MSVIGKRTIFVGPADGSSHKPLNVEGKALAAIAPGTILQQVATGLQANAVAAIIFGHQFIVADKDQMRSKSVDTAWTINENMVGIAPRSGEFVNALVVTGQALIVGTPLSRNGAGLLKIAVTPATVGATSEEIACYADEAVTTTATQLVRVKAV